MHTTKRPITVSGWYEHTDGTFGRYFWVNGFAVLGATAPTWEAALAYDRALDLEP